MRTRHGFEVTLRPAGAADHEFLVAMLVAAAGWREPMTREAVLAAPELRRYVDGWPRAGDVGVLAVHSGGGPADHRADASVGSAQAAGDPVGAAWLRMFDAAEPGYGYVADDVPELCIGVLAGWRGGGVGRALLRTLCAQAAAAGIRRISLSVERANPALALYRSEGFRTLVSGEAADTMVKDLWSRG